MKGWKFVAMVATLALSVGAEYANAGSVDPHVAPSGGLAGEKVTIVDPEQRRLVDDALAVFTPEAAPGISVPLDANKNGEVAHGTLPGDIAPDTYTVFVRLPDGTEFEVGSFEVFREELVVPSPEFPTIQDAIDAAVSGDAIRIEAGTYELSAPIFVDKHLTFMGNGSSGPDRTELVGPLPSSSDDIVNPDLTVAVYNFLGVGGSVQNMMLRGFDAGVFGQDPIGGVPEDKSMNINNLIIKDTVRGIQWRAAGELTIQNTQISDVSWNGISLANSTVEGLSYRLEYVLIVDVGNAGIVFIDQPGICDENHIVRNAGITGGGGPGILVIRSGVCIFDSHISIPTVAGIFVNESAVLIQNTNIFFPLPNTENKFGDGIVVTRGFIGPSEVTVIDSEIKNSHRAGLSNFGSNVTVTDNEFLCQGFAIEGEPLLGFPFSFENGGGNDCRDSACPAILGQSPPPPPGKCIAVTVGLEPPTAPSPAE